MFAAEPLGRVIRMDSMATPERHRIHRWQILIAAAGTLGETELFGRSIIADARLADKFVGPDALALTFPEPGSEDNLYTYAFFCTRFGMQAVRSSSYGTKILGVRKDILAELPIPIPDDSVKKQVADLIRTTVEERERYFSELHATRRFVEQLPDVVEARAMCEERRARCLVHEGSLRTLQAWSYASTGGALEFLQKRWAGRLGDVLEPQGVFNGPRFARIPCQSPYGVEFLSQRHVFLIRPVSRRIAHPGFSDRLFFVPEGSLLVGGHGTLGEGEIFGRVLYVHGKLARTAFTQDLLRVQPKPEFSGLVYAYLSTKVGFRMLRSTAAGTKLLSMRADLLRDLPFPNCDKVTSEKIALHLNAAMSAREAADQAESQAIRILEEEVLPAWLN
jgi:type I restriction enzyme S subunit